MRYHVASLIARLSYVVKETDAGILCGSVGGGMCAMRCWLEACSREMIGFTIYTFTFHCWVDMLFPFV